MANRYSGLFEIENRLSGTACPAYNLRPDRPETCNSVDSEITQITHIWRNTNEDHDINAVMVTGAGKAFSAGGDFELIKSVMNDPVSRMSTWKESKDLVYNVITCNKPIISAINGVAVGAIAS
jgi:enoyl-CoA hydratase